MDETARKSATERMVNDGGETFSRRSKYEPRPGQPAPLTLPSGWLVRGVDIVLCAVFVTVALGTLWLVIPFATKVWNMVAKAYTG